MENDPKKILLIDDSALMRRVMSDIINHIDGFTVAYLAADGEEGYAYLSKQNDIDVVMTDIDMPKMDGLTLIKSRRKQVLLLHLLYSVQERIPMQSLQHWIWARLSLSGNRNISFKRMCRGMLRRSKSALYGSGGKGTHSA